jgi:magnesium chelatase family protein
VLFLDELPEFNRNVLEVLREPLEAGVITIARAGRQADFPANFQLVAAMNPCPCGYLGDLAADCCCSAERVATYRSKISGPLLDRIDLHVEVRRPPKQALRSDAPAGESSSEVAERVRAARDIQLRRSCLCNARLEGQSLTDVCSVSGEALRAYQRVLRVARTIADLVTQEDIAAAHIAEALSLRQLNKRRL